MIRLLPIEALLGSGCVCRWLEAENGQYATFDSQS
nr:hypothetical protein HUO10_006047 [Paraburkholderia busanensis]